MKTGHRIGAAAWLVAALLTGACEERPAKPAPAPGTSGAAATTSPTSPAPTTSPTGPNPSATPTGAIGSTAATPPSASTGPAAPAAAPTGPAKTAVPLKQWDTDNGVIVEELKVGEGAEATKFSDVKLHYIGTLPNGLEFDNSYRRNEPMVVNLGTGMIIKGWKDGIPGMKVGGKRRLTIPPEMAYGKSGRPPMIGPNAMLVFEVELLEIVQ